MNELKISVQSTKIVFKMYISIMMLLVVVLFVNCSIDHDVGITIEEDQQNKTEKTKRERC